MKQHEANPSRLARVTRSVSPILQASVTEFRDRGIQQVWSDSYSLKSLFVKGLRKCNTCAARDATTMPKRNNLSQPKGKLGCVRQRWKILGSEYECYKEVADGFRRIAGGL